MRIATLFPHLAGLRVHAIDTSDGQLTLTVAARRHTASCPHCRRRSRRIHSHYWRHPRDMPVNGVHVTLQLLVRWFFCVNPRCPRRTFAERFPALVAPFARRIRNLDDWLTRVAFALGGEAGARLLQHLGVTICGDTLLAHLRRCPFAEQPTPRILSVDDFAFRRGRIYGSILVDLERHRAVDLLPDRSTETFATWLAARPGIEVISRDRSGEYVEGARQGAPNAIQVTDCFHLLHNLRDVAFRVFKRHAKRLAQVAVPGAAQHTLTHLRLDREVSKAQTRGEMHARFTTIHDLASRGMSRSATVRELGVHRHTVQKYLAHESAPERRHYTRQTSIIAPDEGYRLSAVARRMPQRDAPVAGDRRARVRRIVPKCVAVDRLSAQAGKRLIGDRLRRTEQEPYFPALADTHYRKEAPMHLMIPLPLIVPDTPLSLDQLEESVYQWGLAIQQAAHARVWQAQAALRSPVACPTCHGAR